MRRNTLARKVLVEQDVIWSDQSEGLTTTSVHHSLDDVLEKNENNIRLDQIRRNVSWLNNQLCCFNHASFYDFFYAIRRATRFK